VSEQHLRHEQAFVCSRRAFLPSLLREAVVTLGMMRGGYGGRLSELGELPPEQLARIRPVLNPAYEILVEQDQVWAREIKTDRIVELFSVEDTENLAAFNLFNGKMTLGEVGARLSQELDWDETTAFAHVRDLFLSLVVHLVCVPRDPPA
jgi:hypothetical protein